MNKFTIASLVGAFLLTACGSPKQADDPNAPLRMCVHSYDNGTLTIYANSKYSPQLQAIDDVSLEVAEEITSSLGVC